MKISAAELDVMQILWSEPGLAAADVHQRLTGQKDWTSRTVKTLLARLVEKGALKTEAQGRRFLYTPLITRKAYEAKAARNFVDRVFSGRAAPLVAHLADGKGLSPDDIAELEDLLGKLKS